MPYRTFPQRKKHGASHFVGVDKGNHFCVTRVRLGLGLGLGVLGPGLGLG